MVGFHLVLASKRSRFAATLVDYVHDRNRGRNVALEHSGGSDLATRIMEASRKEPVPERVYVFGPRELADHPLCVRVHDPEDQYRDLVEDVVSRGHRRTDRTRAGTFSVFDRDMRFDLRESLPVLTTKRVFVRGVIEELLWIVSGSTDAGALSEKGVRIWEANSSREFLDSLGMFERDVGDLGPVYGFQWRHAGAGYAGKGADYSGAGVDQLARVIDGIRSDPYSRRHVMSAWQATDLSDMALPPCHSVAVQFYVTRDGELSCAMYQRSVDVALGLPFNIASYGLLTCMLAQVCGLRPGDLSIRMGDCHVYVPHAPIVRDQCRRAPRPFPRLRLDPSVTSIDGFRAEHVVLEGYDPHPAVPMPMF
jgi:thymidylate synthase